MIGVTGHGAPARLGLLIIAALRAAGVSDITTSEPSARPAPSGRSTSGGLPRRHSGTPLVEGRPMAAPVR